MKLADVLKALGYPLRRTPPPGPAGQPLDAFQYEDTASGTYAVAMRQRNPNDVAPALLERWPGRAAQLGRQWQPKMRGNANLKAHGTRTTWDTLQLSPAYIPMARQQQRRSTRYQGQSNFRPAGTINIPAVFIPSAARSFIGGFGKP